MRKILCLLFILLLAFVLIACADIPLESEVDSDDSQRINEVVPPREVPG